MRGHHPIPVVCPFFCARTYGRRGCAGRMVRPGPPCAFSGALGRPRLSPLNLRFAGLSWMARPGLEPGTPRFSVVRPKLSNWAEIPGKHRVLRQVAVRGNRSLSAIFCAAVGYRDQLWYPMRHGGARPAETESVLTEDGALAACTAVAHPRSASARWRRARRGSPERCRCRGAVSRSCVPGRADTRAREAPGESRPRRPTAARTSEPAMDRSSTSPPGCQRRESVPPPKRPSLDRIARAITGAAMLEKPDGSPRLRSVIRAPPPTSANVYGVRTGRTPSGSRSCSRPEHAKGPAVWRGPGRYGERSVRRSTGYACAGGARRRQWCRARSARARGGRRRRCRRRPSRSRCWWAPDRRP